VVWKYVPIHGPLPLLVGASVGADSPCPSLRGRKRRPLKDFEAGLVNSSFHEVTASQSMMWWRCFRVCDWGKIVFPSKRLCFATEAIRLIIHRGHVVE
jgi:hypothetical protein